VLFALLSIENHPAVRCSTIVRSFDEAVTLLTTARMEGEDDIGGVVDGVSEMVLVEDGV